MFDCHKDVLAHHNDKVTLPQPDRSAMRDRRNANRDRLKKGLKENDDPLTREFCKQGSYAMKTMVQHPDNKYDIDDGVYFDKASLNGPNGGDKSSLDARKMVRDAIDDGCFKTPPEVRSNCVRVWYEAGYHVDLPVYRTIVEVDALGNETTFHELAGSQWKRSDARDVTAWFDKTNQDKSPDEENGRQLRRICRSIKQFGKSRSSWHSQIGGGFMITALVAECYRPDADREDRAVYNTMRAIRDRLELNLVVNHPVTPNETITNGTGDSKARVLKEKLTDAIGWLTVLFKSDCTRKEALAAWDKVFNTDYFSERLEAEIKEAASAGILNAGILRDQSAVPPAFNKRGSGTYA